MFFWNALFGEAIGLIYTSGMVLVKREVLEVLAVSPDEGDDIHGGCLCDTVDAQL